MKEKNNQIIIKLTTVIVAILVAIVIFGGIIFVKLNNKNNNTNNQTEIENTTQTEYTQSDIGFSFEFLKKENKKENLIYSPLSIRYGLQMLYEGANGTTKIQIENVIGRQNLVNYENINDRLSLVNALYIRDTYSKSVKDEYKNKLKKDYNAEVKYDSFKNANSINKWIENNTFGQIKNMVADNIVQNPNTEMLIVNALAIDMEWENQFEDTETNGEKFNLNNGNTMTATMMHKETLSDNVSFYKDKNVTSLTMDLKKYNDTQLEFIAIMPNTDLSEYVKKFTVDQLTDISNNSKSASKTKNGVNISIPKFSIKYDLSLKDDLISLSITDAFDKKKADFSNMTNSLLGLYVWEAMHKANIDFTEKGVKAAATTVMVMADKAIIIEERFNPEEIRIDKPFMYLIRDKQTGEIWFVGTVYEPNSWENDRANYKF